MNIYPIPLDTQHVPKAWGYETIICNNDEFCGKLLHFKAGSKFSCHFHVQKREVFWLQRGKLLLMTIDMETAQQNVRELNVGDVIEIPRFLPHQITALEDSDLIEFSTTHRNSDSFRVIPGDSQNKESI